MSSEAVSVNPLTMTQREWYLIGICRSAIMALRKAQMPRTASGLQQQLAAVCRDETPTEDLDADEPAPVPPTSMLSPVVMPGPATVSDWRPTAPALEVKATWDARRGVIPVELTPDARLAAADRVVS